jgi:hypothetical protein
MPRTVRKFATTPLQFGPRRAAVDKNCDLWTWHDLGVEQLVKPQ